MKKFEHPILGTIVLVPMLSGRKPKPGVVLMSIEEGGKFVTKSFDLIQLPFDISKKVLKSYGYKKEKHDDDFLGKLEKGRQSIFRGDGLEVIFVGETTPELIKKTLKRLADED